MPEDEIVKALMQLLSKHMDERFDQVDERLASLERTVGFFEAWRQKLIGFTMAFGLIFTALGFILSDAYAKIRGLMP